MYKGPAELMTYLNQKIGYYHPRTAEQSVAFSNIIIQELVASAGALAVHLKSGKVVYDLDVTVSDGVSEHTTDLVIGSPKSRPLYKSLSGTPTRAEVNPSDYRILVDHKSVVTAHRNRLNRLRDLKELASHANAYNRKSIVGGTLLLGTSLRYLSVETIGRVLSARNQNDKVGYWRSRLLKNDPRLVQEFQSTDAMTRNSAVDPTRTFNVFMTELPMRTSEKGGGFDAFAIIPVRIDNIEPCRLDETSFRRNDRDYHHFIDNVKHAYTERFS